MSGIDLGSGVRKMFLLGVGAVATTAEKGTQVINDLVEKGELTVQQGKALNEELTCKARQTASDGADALLRAQDAMKEATAVKLRLFGSAGRG